MAPTRYIGITDFSRVAQILPILHLRDTMMIDFCEGMQSSICLHVGVMMSYKTLNSLPTKWGDVFPSKESLADIFSCRLPGVMNCLHYADYDGVDVRRSLSRAISYGGPHLHALQLDMVWPNPIDVEAALEQPGKQLEVILQVNTEAMRQCNDSPITVAKRLDAYRGISTHVLLDKSMGRGQGMDAEALIPYAEAISERHPELGLVVAGGLGPDTVQLAEPFLKRFPLASTDAQGQLRTSGSALDPIDWDRAHGYFVNMLGIMLLNEK